jgi:hypothetical protein
MSATSHHTRVFEGHASSKVQRTSQHTPIVYGLAISLGQKWQRTCVPYVFLKLVLLVPNVFPVALQFIPYPLP